MDLEDVEKSEIYSQSYGAYAEFSSQLKPKFRVVWKDIGLGYCLLIAVVVGMCYVESHSPGWGVVLVIPAALIVGFLLLIYSYLSTKRHITTYIPTEK